MKRVVALVLSRLACEIARQKVGKQGGGKTAGPLGVILEPANRTAPELSAALLDVVDDEARRLGVRPGQKVVEATVLAAQLAVHRVTYEEIDAALGRVAEVALAFGPTAAIRLGEGKADEHRTPWGDAPFDTVFVDVTGAAHLHGGEEALLDELVERVSSLGHRVRAAIASGPRLAQALARWAPGLSGAPGARTTGRHPIAAPNEGERAMAPLPVQALPIDPEIVSYLMRLGIITVGDLARLPRAGALARLGARAREILDLALGRDDLPLVAYAPPRVIVEQMRFDEGVESAPELLFVLRGMTSRAAQRLSARGEACTRLEVTIPLDRSVAAIRLAERGEEVHPDDGELSIGFQVDLPAPLSDEGDLLRALRARLERTELFAPAIGLQLSIPQIVEARRTQLDLGKNRQKNPDRLPALLAELSAEIGAEKIGVLAVCDAHKPEARSKLRPAHLGPRPRSGQQLSLPGAFVEPPRLDPALSPMRLLPKPIPLGRVAKGTVVLIDQHLFSIDDLRFVQRLDKAEWWTGSGPSRDYMRAFLSSGDGAARLERFRSIDGPPGRRASSPAGGACGEALVYVDRKTREAFLHGWCE
ncbi:MAG: DNA polymerase Y family protein [Byssovorax sp.]